MIFVFGSNLQGRHGKGAALTAKLHHGAVQGIGEGLMGQSYALPTQHTPYRLMHWKEIEQHVRKFKLFAFSMHYAFEFQVTQVGCGLAGHKPDSIAPMFRDAPMNCLFDEAWREYLGETKRYWGTFP